jgi:hypothetical protein
VTSTLHAPRMRNSHIGFGRPGHRPLFSVPLEAHDPPIWGACMEDLQGVRLETRSQGETFPHSFFPFLH